MTGQLATWICSWWDHLCLYVYRPSAGPNPDLHADRPSGRHRSYLFGRLALNLRRARFAPPCFCSPRPNVIEPALLPARPPPGAGNPAGHMRLPGTPHATLIGHSGIQTMKGCVRRPLHVRPAWRRFALSLRILLHRMDVDQQPCYPITGGLHRHAQGTGMMHTSIASPGLRLLLLSGAQAKCGCSRLPKRVRRLPGCWSTKGRDRRGLPKRWLGRCTPKSWLCLAVLLLSGSKQTCRVEDVCGYFYCVSCTLWMPTP